MKYLLLILFFFSAITLGLSQTSRFDKTVKYDFEMDIPKYNPKTDPGVQLQCRKMINMINEMVRNMKLVSEQQKLYEGYSKMGNWYVIEFDNSDWLKNAQWIYAEGLFKSPYVAIELLDGKKYFYPDVPKNTFLSWEYASSPGEYFHRHIKKYSLRALVPDFCN